jgi:hypothetical protein
LATELVEAGVPPHRLRRELRALVLDVLRLVLVAHGDYRFASGPHPYGGAPWIDLHRLLGPASRGGPDGA